MAAPAIQITGLKELQRNLRQVKNTELDNELKAIYKELALEIGRRAAPKVPVRTGKLFMSVRGFGNVSGAVGKAGGGSVPYAPPIHWGHAARNIEARPFLRQAAEELERDIVDRYDKAVAGMLDRVVGR